MTADLTNNIHQGFILQATYRVQDGIPIVYLFGQLADGGRFLVRDNRQRPHFYVRTADAGHVLRAQVSATALQDATGQPLSKVEVRVPQEAPGVRDALHASGLPTFEADVRFAMRYLIDRQVKGLVGICGTPRQAKNLTVFDNPTIAPGQLRPSEFEPRVLSFDIETNPDQDKLLAISCFGCGVDEVVVVDAGPRPAVERTTVVATEAQALQWFMDKVRDCDPDVLTGWNVIDFDLTYLSKVANRCRLPLNLGRLPGDVRIRKSGSYLASGQATVPGRVVLDGVDLVRGSFVQLPGYSLEQAAQHVLGEGKTIAVQGDTDKVAEILERYHHRPEEFSLYARTDARLVLQVLHKLRLLELTWERCALTGMPPDRVGASVASFDFLYLGRLGQRGMAAPSVNSPGPWPGLSSASVSQSGGAVFEPDNGIHKNVWIFDFKSLYPSIIRSFNIDPTGFVQANAGTDLVEEIVQTSDGTRFAATKGILPTILDELFPRRLQAQQVGNQLESQALKILMNSFYGVLGTQGCRFCDPRLTNAITGQGRHLLEWTRSWFEAQGYQVVYGDTDSVFVASLLDEPETAMTIGKQLVAAFNDALNEYVSQLTQRAVYLELELEKLYTTLFLAKVRNGTAGARKRYAGIRLGADGPEFVGMEVVRRDWTEIAKRVQQKLYALLFAGDMAQGADPSGEIEDYVRSLVAAVRNGEHDDELVYTKQLRKPVEQYTANVPPHVRAVRLHESEFAGQSGGSGLKRRVVNYVQTLRGPVLLEDLALCGSPLDREHYVERQIEPVVQPVFEILQRDFDQVIGDDRQVELF